MNQAASFHELLVNLSLSGAVGVSLGVQLVSLLAGEQPERVLLKGSVAMAAMGGLGFLFILAAGRTWGPTQIASDEPYPAVTSPAAPAGNDEIQQRVNDG